MYDPKIGQFLSEDPIGFDGLDENLHRYVRNSPLTARDPTGLILEVDGVIVTTNSDIYKGLSKTSVGSEILDTLRASGSTYRYSKEVLQREVAGRIAIVNAAEAMAERIKKGQLIFGEKMYLENPQERLASDLLKRILSQKEIVTECYNGVELVYLDALHRWLGTDAFNTLFASLSKLYKKRFEPFP